MEPAALGDVDSGDEPGDEPLGEPAAEAPAKQPARPAKGRGRASVPSWDEIMFGTPKDS